MGLTLTYPRRFDTSDFTVLTAAVKVLQGACTCSVIASGLATGGAFSNATHRFCGFALDTAEAGQRLRLKNKGRTLLNVTGASAAKANAVVYASDDNTFTVTPAGGEVAIGRIAWVEEGEKAVVDFDASIEAGQVGTKVNEDGSVSLVGPGGPINANSGSNKVILWGDSMTYDTEYHTSMAVSGYNFSRTSGVTTVTLNSHGLNTGREIRVTRADGSVSGEGAFSGKFNITRTGANTFTYPQPGMPDEVGIISSAGVGVKGFVGFTDSTRDRGFFAWINLLLGQPFELVDNLAVNGWRSDQAAAVVDSIIAQRPGWVFSQVPGINDLFGDQSIGGGLAHDADHVISNLETSLNKFYNAGIKLVLVNLTPPRNDNVNNLDVAKIEVYKVNKWLKKWCELRRQNVRLIDGASIMMKTDMIRPASNLYFASGGSNTVNSTVTIKSDSGPFTSGHVGYVVERTDTYGRALITAYVSATQVTAKIQRAFSAFPTSAGAAFGSGSWTLQADHIAKPGYNSDTIHYSPRGAYYVAKDFVADPGFDLPKRSPLAVSISDNINSHGVSASSDDSIGWNVWEHAPWESTGGTVTGPSTGTAPKGWTVGGAPASTTCASSVIDSPFGPGKALQLSVTSSAGAATTQQAYMSSGALAFRVIPEGQYVIEIPFEITGDLVAKEFWAEPSVTIDGVGGTLGVMHWNMATTEAEAVPDVWSGMLRSQLFTLPPGSSLSSFSVYCKIKLWNSTSIPVVVKIGNTSVERVG